MFPITLRTLGRDVAPVRTGSDLELAPCRLPWKRFLISSRGLSGRSTQRPDGLRKPRRTGVRWLKGQGRMT